MRFSLAAVVAVATAATVHAEISGISVPTSKTLTGGAVRTIKYRPGAQVPVTFTPATASSNSRRSTAPAPADQQLSVVFGLTPPADTSATSRRDAAESIGLPAFNLTNFGSYSKSASARRPRPFVFNITLPSSIDGLTSTPQQYNINAAIWGLDSTGTPESYTLSAPINLYKPAK